MITRALEDHEIQATFNCVGGCHAKRNETMLVCGIGMALRASELVGLNVGDVFNAGTANESAVRCALSSAVRCALSSATPSACAKSYVTIR